MKLSKKKKEGLRNLGTHVVLIFIVLFMLLPLLSMVGTAFTKHDEVLTRTEMFPPLGEWSIENFVGVLEKTNYVIPKVGLSRNLAFPLLFCRFRSKDSG